MVPFDVRQYSRPTAAEVSDRETKPPLPVYRQSAISMSSAEHMPNMHKPHPEPISTRAWIYVTKLPRCVCGFRHRQLDSIQRIAAHGDKRAALHQNKRLMQPSKHASWIDTCHRLQMTRRFTVNTPAGCGHPASETVCPARSQRRTFEPRARLQPGVQTVEPDKRRSSSHLGPRGEARSSRSPRLRVAARRLAWHESLQTTHGFVYSHTLPRPP